MWSVAPPTVDQARARFDSDSIDHTTELVHVLDKAMGSGELTLHTLPMTMEYPPFPSALTDILSPTTTSNNRKMKHSTEHLLEALHIARLVKTEEEIGLIREANRITSAAHEVLMRELGRYADGRAGKAVRGGTRVRDGKEGVREWEVESEGDAEALFVAACRRQG
jgi:Xaa-Pro dipeptidase